jgi:hypothetical protein
MRAHPAVREPVLLHRSNFPRRIPMARRGPGDTGGRYLKAACEAGCSWHNIASATHFRRLRVLASLSMSADEPSAEWVPPGWDPPSAGRAAVPPWPPAPPMPQAQPRSPVAWLAGPAASPLLTAAAVVTAAGWSAAATVLAVTVATGHPQAAAASVVGASAFVLPVVDLVTVIALGGRKRAQPAPRRAARGFRKAARRAHRATGAGSGLMSAMRSSARSLRRPARFPFLPRPVRWGFAAMLWLTAVATAWALARGLPSWDLATARGQEMFAAWTWMMHLVVWCRIACTRLNRSRSEPAMLASAHAATSK